MRGSVAVIALALAACGGRVESSRNAEPETEGGLVRCITVDTFIEGDPSPTVCEPIDSDVIITEQGRCSPGARQCNGAVLVQCAPDGLAFEVVEADAEACR